MKVKQPLMGPFVSGYYKPSTAELNMMYPGGERQIIPEVYPAMFVPSEQLERVPDFVYKYVITSQPEGRYERILLEPGIRRAYIDEILHACREVGVYPLEADVDPIRRWFSDTGVGVSSMIEPLFFDIETKPLMPGFDDEAKKRHMVLSYAASDMHGNFWFEHNTTVDGEGEELLLRQFLALASRFNTLLAWNGKDYDFFVMKHRCDLYKLNPFWGQWNLLDYMLTVKKCLMSISSPKFKRSFALDNIGQNVLGINKLKLSVPPDQLDRLILEERISELRAYNGRDVEIMVALEEEREFLQLHLAVCALCRKFPDLNSLYPNTLADGLMLRLGIREGRHFKSRYSDANDGEDSKYQGAYVMDAVLGFHQQVQVIDFASLYPSIIISWNMSPETIRRDNYTYPPEATFATATATGIQFRTDFEGMLPMALRQLIQQRKIYAQKQKDAIVGSDEWKRYGHESTALKVVANSMYGLTGSPYSRYYDRGIAESVTLSGQFLIKECIRFAEDHGVRVIAGDTDSCFVQSSEDETKELIEALNSQLIPSLTLEKSKCRVNLVKMDFDKGYSSLLIQAKKKYAGQLSLHKGRPAPSDMEPDVKGLEFQRSDQIRYAQRLQMRMLHYLLDPDMTVLAIESIMNDESEKFFTETINVEDVAITQSVQKHPDHYVNPTPAVRIARDMIAKGREFYTGMKVPYVITRDNKDGMQVAHIDDCNGHFDKHHYWTKKILPPVSRLIRARFQDHKFRFLDTLEKNPRQGVFEFQDPIKTRSPMTQIITKRPIKIRDVVIEIDGENGGEETIVGLSKLAKASRGPIRLNFVISTPDGKVGVSTKERVDERCLREMKKIFPWITIKDK